MNPDERETWTERLKWYESFESNPIKPKTFKTFMESVKSGREVYDWIRRITADALNKSKEHPDKSSWKEELEQSIPALQKALQQNEERTKGKMLTKQETEALRDARQALSDAQFLLAYASGLVKQKAKKKAEVTPKTFTYDEDNPYVYTALNRLFVKGYLTQRIDKNGKAYFCFRRGAVDDDSLNYNEIKAILKSSGIEGKDSEVVTNFLNTIDFRTYTGARRITTATELNKLWFHG